MALVSDSSTNRHRFPATKSELPQDPRHTWVWLKIKQEGLRRLWSMFPLTRVPFWYRFFEPQPHGDLLLGHRLKMSRAGIRSINLTARAPPGPRSWRWLKPKAKRSALVSSQTHESNHCLLDSTWGFGHGNKQCGDFGPSVCIKSGHTKDRMVMEGGRFTCI